VNPVSISLTDSPDRSVILSLTKPYFAKMQTEQAVERYCRTSSLGPVLHLFAYWGDHLAGLVSAFPFPLVIAGERLVVWLPELGSLHQRIALQASRPDIFGSLLDELIRSARTRGVPLIHTQPSPLAINSFRKRGFQCVRMPLTKIKWPLTANYLSESLSKILRVRFGYKGRGAAVAAVLARACRFLPVKAVARLATITPRPYRFQAIPIQSIPKLDASLQRLNGTDRTIYVPWDANFLSSRLREEDGYEFLCITDCEDCKTVGWLIIQMTQDGIVIIDGIPPNVFASGRFWTSLLRYAMNRRAEYMYVRLYHNNPAHRAALNVIRHRVPGPAMPSEVVIAVLALDENAKCAYNPSLWAGSDMLHVGF
jgi:hypothetical protein